MKKNYMVYISLSGARSNFRVGSFLNFLPGEEEGEEGVNMLSVRFNWFIRCKAFSISLSRPRRLDDAGFFDRGLRVGE
jgi:hypothetical protein